MYRFRGDVSFFFFFLFRPPTLFAYRDDHRRSETLHVAPLSDIKSYLVCTLRDTFFGLFEWNFALFFFNKERFRKFYFPKHSRCSSNGRRRNTRGVNI